MTILHYLKINFIYYTILYVVIIDNYLVFILSKRVLAGALADSLMGMCKNKHILSVMFFHYPVHSFYILVLLPLFILLCI